MSAAAEGPLRAGGGAKAANGGSGGGDDAAPPRTNGAAAASAAVPSVDDMRTLCDRLKAKVDGLVQAPADDDDDDLRRGVRARVRAANLVIEEALRRYRPEELLLAYNGGKDCLVLLILILAALSSHFPESGPTSDHDANANAHTTTTTTTATTSSSSIAAAASASLLPSSLQVLYIRPPRPFAEVDEFVTTSTAAYRLDLTTSDRPMKAALADYLAARPQVKAVFVGTRRTDPHGANLSDFDETDPDWPRFMRVHPVLDWHYREIWGFIRALDIPYCPLYDMGYTSLGGTDDTHPNPALKRKTAAAPGQNSEEGLPLTFRPAYELMEDDEERLGRDR